MTQEHIEAIERIVNSFKATNGVGIITTSTKGKHKETAINLVARSYLLNKGYIEEHPDPTFGNILKQYSLTKRGFAFTSYAEASAKEQEEAALADRVQRVNLANAENTLKTYKTTRFLAWLGAIVGVLGFALSLYLTIKGKK